MTFVVLGFVTMIVVQLIENYTTGATAVTGTGVSSKFMSSSHTRTQQHLGQGPPTPKETKCIAALYGPYELQKCNFY